MKKLLLFALFIGTGTLLVSSCDKEEVTPEVITTNFTLKDFTDVDSLGYYHNGIVRAAVDAGSETAEKIRQHVVSTYNLDPSFDYTIEELVDYTYSPQAPLWCNRSSGRGCRWKQRAVLFSLLFPSQRLLLP